SFMLSVAFDYFSMHDSPTTVIYTLSLHDALPIFFNYPGRTFASKVATRSDAVGKAQHRLCSPRIFAERRGRGLFEKACPRCCRRWEGHTSELQSPYDLVCRLLREKRNFECRNKFW